MNTPSIKQFLTAKYPEIEGYEVDFIIASACSIFMGQTGVESTYEIDNKWDNWITRCCIEIIERDKVSGGVSFSENGMSVHYDRTQVSYGLLSELPNNLVVHYKKEI